MTAVSLFPFAEYWWFYGAFTLFVLGLLALDLGVFYRRAQEVSTREALSWSVVGPSWRSGLLPFSTAIACGIPGRSGASSRSAGRWVSLASSSSSSSSSSYHSPLLRVLRQQVHEKVFAECGDKLPMLLTSISD